MSKIALVTVLFNSDNVLQDFFSCLSKQTFSEYHLFLIDNSANAATDKLINELKNQFSNIHFTHVKNDHNVGVAKGNNQGIEISLREGFQYTLLLNNDIEFSQDFLIDAIYNVAQQQNECLLIPKIFFYDTHLIWMAGGTLSRTKGIVYHIGEGDKDGPKYHKPAYFDYAPTCFMLINNKVFHDIGIMNAEYFVYYDDTDFIYRAIKKGYKILFLPTLEVLHKVSSSTGGDESLFSIYYTTRNRIYFLRKNFRGLSLLIPLVYTLATRFVRAFMYNRSQRTRMMKALKDGFSMKLNA